MAADTEVEDAPETDEPELVIETVRLEHLEIGPDSQVVFRLPINTPHSISVAIAEEVGRRFPDRSMVLVGDVQIEVIDSVDA